MTRPALALVALLACVPASAGEWKADPVWHDGLVEKAVYRSTRIVYGEPRQYEAVFFTNKEQHDTKTLTKAEKSDDTVEVWKHNQVEVISTPNYDYKYVTTSHLTADSMELTRLDASSQEFCGTSFKQYLRDWPQKRWDYWSFSYMPEAGRVSETVKPFDERPVIAEDALPLWLRDYDFQNRPEVQIWLLPSQKSNRATPFRQEAFTVRHAGEEDGSEKLELYRHWPTKTWQGAFAKPGKLHGRYWMANDRLHVMTRYRSADGSQSHELTGVDRVDYWTIPPR